jgi:molybdopterin-guanine dinucleotide biosynthesis protein A
MPTIDATPAGVTGVILAGGLSRRMGGGDKGLLDLAGASMIARVAARLAPQVDAMIVNGNGDPTRFSALGCPVVADPIAGYVGPLAGILAGMEWARRNRPQDRYVVSVSSDAPFIPADLVPRLRAALAERPTAIAVAKSADGLHPVIGLWPVCHAENLAAALTADTRKVLDWTDRHGTVPVPFDAVEIDGEFVDPFFNANTPEELAKARDLVRRSGA